MIFKDVALQIPKPYLNTTLYECGQTRQKYEKPREDDLKVITIINKRCDSVP